jgi:DNA-binding transcriptional regulator YbjK
MSREKDEKNTQEFTNRILDAAEKLFADKGFDATGTTEIAGTADITKSLIYYYFKNKEAIRGGVHHCPDRGLPDFRFLDKPAPNHSHIRRIF